MKEGKDTFFFGLALSKLSSETKVRYNLIHKVHKEKMISCADMESFYA